MKNLFAFVPVVMMALATLSLTSCDEDQIIGMELDGTWEGDMYMYSEYGGRSYRATRTVVEFNSNLSMSNGTGYWIDYYSDAPWNYTASHIRWTVVDRTIRIQFVEDDYVVHIYDYSVSRKHFSGVIEGEDGKTLTFSLVSTDPEDWDSYDYGGYYYDYGYSDYGYSKSADFTRAAGQDAVSDDKPVRHIGLD